MSKDGAGAHRKRPSHLAVGTGLSVVYLAWGSTYLAIRFGIETLPPLLMAGTRLLIAGLILYVWSRLRGIEAPSRREWRSAAALGALFFAGGVGGVTWAEQRVASGPAALVVSTTPLWIIVLDVLALRSRLRPSVGAAILIGFGGTALLVTAQHEVGGLAGMDLVAIVILIAAAVSWAMGSLLDRTPNSRPVLMTAGLQMLFGGGQLLLLGTLLGEWSRLDLRSASSRSLWALAYLTIIGSIVAFSAYAWLLRVAPISLVSTYAYVNPVIAIFLGWAVGNEPLTSQMIVATVVIVSSVIAVTQWSMSSHG